MIRNNKGGLYGVIVGLAIVAIGIIGYIVLHTVFLGTGGESTGLFGMAEENLNISTNESAYQTVRNTWTYLPLGLLFAGVLYIIVSSQRREYEEYTYAPRPA